MQNDNNSFENITREATNQVLAERELRDRVRVSDVEPTIDSDDFVVGLKETVEQGKIRRHSFRIDAAEAVQQPQGDTVEGVKPLVDRELLKLFPKPEGN
jgi:hypothetical protein